MPSPPAPSSRPFDLLVVGDANPDVVLGPVPRDLAYGQREQLVERADLVLGGSAAIMACGAAGWGCAWRSRAASATTRRAPSSVRPWPRAESTPPP